MNALRISLVAVMCFGWLPSLADGTLSAAEHVIQAIPGDALGFVALNRLGATASELKATSERLQMPLPDLLGMLKSRLGVTEGLDDTGSAALVALPRPQGGMPALLLYVPVTDYQKFLSALKPEDATAALVNVQVMNNAAVAANRPGFAVLTQPGDREILARAVGTKQSVAGQLPGLLPWCEQQQMAVWVTRPGVRTLCTAGKQGLQVAQQAVEASFKQAGKGDQLAAVSAGLDVYRSLFEAAEKVVTNVALGLRWDDEGTLFVTKQVHVDPESKIAAALGKLAPASSSPMVGLPAGRYLVAAGMQIPEEMTETMIDLSAALMKSTPRLYGLDEHSVDTLMESGRPMMKRLRGMSFEVGVAEPGEPLY